MLPRVINLGPFTIHLYGLIIAVSIYLGWLLAKRRASLYKIPKEIFDDPILITPLVLGVIGARLYHVLDFWSFYIQNPKSTFYLTSGGLGIWGAIAGMTAGFLIVAKIRKLDILASLDLAAPSILLGQMLGRFGNFINQEGFGPPTEKPWGVFIEEQYRPDEFINFTNFHPTFFYEAALNGIFLVVLLCLSKRLRKKGQAFALYLIFYGVSRFIVEFWRIDTWVIGNVKIAQLVSFLVVIIGLSFFFSVKNFDRS